MMMIIIKNIYIFWVAGVHYNNTFFLQNEESTITCIVVVLIDTLLIT